VSKLSAYRQKEQALAKLQAELTALKESSELQEDLAFMDEAKALLEKFSKTPEEFADMFGLTVPKVRAKSERKARTFKNPATGETLQAKSTNNKTLRQWAADANVDVSELEVN